MTDTELQILINKKDTEEIVRQINQMKSVIIHQKKELDFYKSRLVEVCCECKEKENCLSFPEYCEGEKKDIVCLLNLLGEASDKGRIH